MSSEPIRVAGFWIRFAANAVDGTLLTVVSVALQAAILYPVFWIASWWSVRSGHSGHGTFFQFYDPLFLEFFNAGLYGCLAFPYYVWFHFRKGATPGKMWAGVQVVDRTTHQKLSLGASIRRCLGYLLSYGVVGAGFFDGGL